MSQVLIFFVILVAFVLIVAYSLSQSVFQQFLIEENWLVATGNIWLIAMIGGVVIAILVIAFLFLKRGS